MRAQPCELQQPKCGPLQSQSLDQAIDRNDSARLLITAQVHYLYEVAPCSTVLHTSPGPGQSRHNFALTLPLPSSQRLSHGQQGPAAKDILHLAEGISVPPPLQGSNM